jgi:hypothetical protein
MGQLSFDDNQALTGPIPMTGFAKFKLNWQRIDDLLNFILIAQKFAFPQANEFFLFFLSLPDVNRNNVHYGKYTAR